MVRRTWFDLAAVAARSDTRLRARPTSSRVEPGLADGLEPLDEIDRSRDPSQLPVSCGRSGDSGRSHDSGLGGDSGRSGGSPWLQVHFHFADAKNRPSERGRGLGVKDTRRPKDKHRDN